MGLNTHTKVRVIKRGVGAPRMDLPAGAEARPRPSRGVRETVGRWVDEFELRRLTGRPRSFESLFEKAGEGGVAVKGCEGG